MDDKDHDRIEDQNETPYIRSRGLFVEGIFITPQDYPRCIFDDDYECETCEFFIPSNCKLRKDPIYRHDVQISLQLLIEQQVRIERERRKYIERRNKITDAAIKELQEHGRPLHYIYLAKIIRARYPNLGVTDSELVKALSNRPELFEKLDKGIYKAAK